MHAELVPLANVAAAGDLERQPPQPRPGNQDRHGGRVPVPGKEGGCDKLKKRQTDTREGSRFTGRKSIHDLLNDGPVALIPLSFSLGGQKDYYHKEEQEFLAMTISAHSNHTQNL